MAQPIPDLDVAKREVAGHKPHIMATFLTEPLDKYVDTRCSLRDHDGYIIEVGQSKTRIPLDKKWLTTKL